MFYYGRPTPSLTVGLPQLGCVGEGDDLFGGVLHAVADGEVHAGLGDEAAALFDVGAFEADDDRHLNADGPGGLDDAARDHVGADDAAEDVDEHGADGRVGEQDAEGRLDPLLRGAAAHVEEVGGLAARELDDVHRRHREPRAVDHAGDVAVELDVVEVELRRLDLQRLLLVEVAQGVEVRVAEHRVVVEGDLGVEREQPPVLRQEERVDLKQRGVGLLVRVVERLHELGRLVDERRGQSQPEGELARLEGAEADGRVDGLLQNQFGRVGGDLFDVHAAGRGGHEDGAPRRAVEHDAEVELLINREPLFDEQRAHLAPLGAGLVRDELHAEYLAGQFLRLVGALRDLDAAALAAAARVYLRLDDDDLRAQLLRRVIRLLGRARDNPARHRDAVLPQKLLRLVLVNLHPRPLRRPGTR